MHNIVQFPLYDFFFTSQGKWPIIDNLNSESESQIIDTHVIKFFSFKIQETTGEWPSWKFNEIMSQNVNLSQYKWQLVFITLTWHMYAKSNIVTCALLIYLDYILTNITSFCSFYSYNWRTYLSIELSKPYQIRGGIAPNSGHFCWLTFQHS